MTITLEYLLMQCLYRPCHSLIFDVEDDVWNDHFTEAELDEVRDYKFKELIDPLAKPRNYLEDLSQGDVSIN